MCVLRWSGRERGVFERRGACVLKLRETDGPMNGQTVKMQNHTHMHLTLYTHSLHTPHTGVHGYSNTYTHSILTRTLQHTHTYTHTNNNTTHTHTDAHTQTHTG